MISPNPIHKKTCSAKLMIAPPDISSFNEEKLRGAHTGHKSFTSPKRKRGNRTGGKPPVAPGGVHTGNKSLMVASRQWHPASHE